MNPVRDSRSVEKQTALPTGIPSGMQPFPCCRHVAYLRHAIYMYVCVSTERESLTGFKQERHSPPVPVIAKACSKNQTRENDGDILNPVRDSRSVETQTYIYIACRRYATCRQHGKSCIPDGMPVGRVICFSTERESLTGFRYEHHSERSEAIQLHTYTTGLLRCARNDGRGIQIANVRFI